MKQQPKFHVGDFVFRKYKQWGAAATVVQVRGLKWVKLTTPYWSKTWWTVDDLVAAPAQFVDKPKSPPAGSGHMTSVPPTAPTKPLNAGFQDQPIQNTWAYKPPGPSDFADLHGPVLPFEQAVDYPTTKVGQYSKVYGATDNLNGPVGLNFNPDIAVTAKFAAAATQKVQALQQALAAANVTLQQFAAAAQALESLHGQTDLTSHDMAAQLADALHVPMKEAQQLLTAVTGAFDPPAAAQLDLDFTDSAETALSQQDLEETQVAPAQEPVKPEIIEKVKWVPVVPGTLQPGDLVAYPPYNGAAMIATDGESILHKYATAWVKLAAPEQWHKAATLYRQQTVKFLADGVTPLWNPQPPNWTAWKNHWAPWRNSLTTHEKAALTNYCGSGYSAINGCLRKGLSWGVHKSHIESMDAAINRGQIPFDLHVYRSGTSKFDLTVKPGQVIEDLGFVSTSTSAEFAKGWHNSGVFMTIRLPAGTRAAYVVLVSPHHHEREVILPRGTKFRVLELTKVPGKRPELTVEVVQ